MIDRTDSFSKAGGAAFKKAAEDKGMDVYEENYQSESKDMTQVIQKIITERRCKATVVFGEYADYSALLLAAHEKGWIGEWIMGSNFVNGVDEIRAKLKESNIGPKNVDKILDGVYGFA